MREIGFCTLEETCRYLKDRKIKTEYKFIEHCPKSLNEELVYRGWRRFGCYFSRPICEGCEECLSVRILVNDFKFSKSQRRVIRKNQNTKIVLKAPQISNEHLFLYDKYHRFMEKKRAWKRYDLNFHKYFNLYVDGAMDFAYELDFYIDEKLVCVDLIDIFDGGISSIYCFYDPDYREFSLGKFSLLSEIKLAKKRNLKHIYLGYFVKKCQSLSYKADYTPREILRGTSMPCEKLPLWEYDDASGADFRDD